MRRLWSSHHVFSDPITFALRSWRSYRLRSAIRHVRMKHYPNTWLFVLNNFAYFTLSISGHDVVMVGKCKPGLKGKGRARKIPAQKPPPKPINEDADVDSEGESASIAKTNHRTLQWKLAHSLKTRKPTEVDNEPEPDYVSEGISHPVFCGDLVYKLRRVKCEFRPVGL